MIIKKCKKHGETEFRKSKRGDWFCVACARSATMPNRIRSKRM